MERLRILPKATSAHKCQNQILSLKLSALNKFCRLVFPPTSSLPKVAKKLLKCMSSLQQSREKERGHSLDIDMCCVCLEHPWKVGPAAGTVPGKEQGRDSHSSPYSLQYWLVLPPSLLSFFPLFSSPFQKYLQIIFKSNSTIDPRAPLLDLL